MTEATVTSLDHFEEETTMDNRPCHLVISTLDELVVTSLASVPSAKIFPRDKDILIYADQLTIHGKISAPGKRIWIFTDKLSVVPGSSPELSTEPAAKTNSTGLTTISDLPNIGLIETTRDQKLKLPKSADDFRNNGAVWNLSLGYQQTIISTVGWIAHYTIGVVFALVFVVLTSGDWLARPTLLPALL